MSTDAAVFHRTAYAEQMADQLLNPGPLYTNVRSGVFLSGIRRVGKTTFLRQDLVPALESRGALVIYVDLWADRTKNPASLLHEAVRETLMQLQTSGSAIARRIKGLNMGAFGLSLGLQLETIGAPGGATLAQTFEALVSRTGRDVVVIVDEIQQALGSDEGYNLLHALKAARDAVNANPESPGHFLLLGTGSHKSLITDMASRRNQPFTGALATTFDVLGKDFVEWQLQRISRSASAVLPSLQVAWDGFRAMGHRPEELLKAIVQLQQTSAPPDDAFPIICETLASAAADVELRAIDDFGELGRAIFERIAAGREEGVSGIFSAEALAEYSRRTGSSVETNQVQGVTDKMIAANLIARPAHGVYTVADPFVRKVWQQRNALESGATGRRT